MNIMIMLKLNCKALCLALALAGILSADAQGQVNIEDEASAQTPFELLWGFDTGG